MTPSATYCQRYDLVPPAAASWYRAFGKRLFDLAICLPIAIVIAPVVLLAIVLIKLDSRGPAFFVQERLGRYGVTFLTFKLRSMTDVRRSANAEVLPGNSEVTRVGHWLRRFKIDEMPQLWNVLNGDMSFVGPRPALPDAIREYNTEGLRRLLERPGLTGLAQVNGNIYLSWPERWSYDADYVSRVSFLLDVGIVLKTAAVVTLGEERFLRRREQATPQPESERRAA